MKTITVKYSGKKLKNITSLDICGGNANIVKHLSNEFVQPLARLFNACILEGFFLSRIKLRVQVSEREPLTI